MDPGFLVCGTWIPDTNPQWNSGFLDQYSRFQSPGFQILQAKISRILCSESKKVLDSGIRIPLHGSKKN